MKRQINRVRFLAVTFVSLFAFVDASVACVISSTKPLPPPKFAPDFDVSVLAYGKSLPSATVELRSGVGAATLVQTAVANQDGVAQFRSIPAGTYYVAFERAGIQAGEQIQVVGSGLRRRKKLSLAWLSGKPVRVQRLSGKLWFLGANTSRNTVFNIVYSVDSPLKSAALSVTDTSNSEVVWRGTTDQEGQFEGPKIENGVYLLAIKEDRSQPIRSFFEINDWIPIEVTGDGAKDIDLQLGMSDCGMSYSRACHSEVIETGRACGTVVDSEGAAIPGARVQVYSIGLTTREERKTNADGSFDFGELAAGGYQLRVLANGFAAFTGRVRLTDNLECNRRMQVQLAAMVGGEAACSVAGLRPPESR